MQNIIKNISLASIIIFSVFCSIIIGISWDEPTHLDMGYRKLNYLFSLGIIDNDYWFSKFYPGISFAISAFFVKLFPQRYEFEALHLINLFVSFSAVFAISKITKELFNSHVSKIVFLACSFHPILFGHMSMNGKDTIVTTSFTWIIYFILRYFKNQSVAEKRNIYIIKIAFALALGTGARIVFLGSLLPVLVFCLLEILYFKKFISKKFLLKKFIFDLLKIFIIFYFILILFWSQTHSNIFIMPVKIFFESFSNFKIGAAYGLLYGEFYNIDKTPKSYLLINFLFKTPEYILFLFLLTFYFFTKHNLFYRKEFTNFNYKLFFIYFVLLISNFLFLVSPYPFYDGMRLFLYLLPLFIILPSLSFYFIITKLKFITYKILFSLILLLFFIFIFNFFSLTPYQYVYLNLLSGKSSTHESKFENDYWALSLKELIGKSSFLNKKNTKLALCGVDKDNVKYYLKHYRFLNTQVVRSNEIYDYIIMTNRAVDEDGSGDISNVQTCFQKYKGENVSVVKRNNLILSTIRKINQIN